MKKFILSFICIILGFILSDAQSKDSGFYVYGVDFSEVKVFGASESVDDFSKAFTGINMLLLSEPGKYDFSRVFRRKVDVDIAPVLQKLGESDFSEMMTFSSGLQELDCAEIVKGYNLSHTEGTGAVLIARQLNKGTDIGHYYLVVFDIATREISEQMEVQGKTGGFGLRNYWARTVYNVILSKTLF